jgi:hypothetical protein
MGFLTQIEAIYAGKNHYNIGFKDNSKFLLKFDDICPRKNLRLTPGPLLRYKFLTVQVQ